LYVLHSGQVPMLHRGWFDQTRTRLRRVDTQLLRALIPAPRPHVASFLLSGAREPSTSIDVQLAAVARCSMARLEADLEVVWRGKIPPEAKQVLEQGGGPRIAEALHEYWRVAIKPFWPQICAVLDADVAYRATRLARGGIEALLTDLHPELELAQHAITVQSSASGSVHDLCGAGLLLVPCVFAWPHVMVDIDAGNPASITYAARGIGELWPQNSPAMRSDDALADLLGRTRAAVLRAVALPRCTSDLAAELGQSMPAISAQLTVLRHAGPVSSWRAGRRVLYQLTPLARSVLAASSGALTHEISEWADDPFVNNTVQPWQTPTAPQYGCTGVLESGDPVVGIGFAICTNTFEQGPTPNGYQVADGYYHPEDAAFLPWFMRTSPNTISEPTQSASTNVGRYILMGDLNPFPGFRQPATGC